MSPASGDDANQSVRTQYSNVSIQLMSPASGDFGLHSKKKFRRLRFHSINVPSEWGLRMMGKVAAQKAVSIQLMSPASGDLD